MHTSNSANNIQITHVIFDMDGILLDSEKLYEEARTLVASKFNKTFPLELKLSITGRPSGECAEDIIRGLNLPLNKEEFLRIYSAECERLFSAPVALMPGADRLVRHLHRHQIPIAIATSSKRSNFDLKAQFHRELFSLFEHILISPDEPEIVRGKPDPKVFELAAQRFRTPPASAENVLIFEDSISGIKAALSAGMNCVWIPDPRVSSISGIDDCQPTIRHESLLDFRPELFGLPAFD